MKTVPLLAALLGLSFLSPVSAYTEQEMSAANTCFLASTAVETIVQARLSGHPMPEVKARTARTFGSANENFAAYLVNQVEQVYAQKPDSPLSYALRHNSSCLAQLAPTMPEEKPTGCYFYARHISYLAQSRDKGVTQAELTASLRDVPAGFEEVSTLAIKKVFDAPANKFESLSEYKACLNAPTLRQ